VYYIPREVAPPPQKKLSRITVLRRQGGSDARRVYLILSYRVSGGEDNQRVSGKLAVPKCRSNAQVSLGHTVVSKCCKDHAWYPARLVPSRDTEPR